MVASTPTSTTTKRNLKESKTGLRNSTQHGSIKAQRHNRSHTNFETKKQTIETWPLKFESKLNGDSCYLTNFKVEKNRNKRHFETRSTISQTQ